MLEDKKRCLTDVTHVNHVLVNNIDNEVADPKTSHKALSENKKHMRFNMVSAWDKGGKETPPHHYTGENQPHYSHKELSEKKKRMQTGLRKNSEKIENNKYNVGPSRTAQRVL